MKKYKTYLNLLINKKYAFRKILLLPLFTTIFLLDIYKPLLIESKENLESVEIDLNYLDNSRERDYILGPGDFLNIEISEELPSLTKTYTIGVAGTVNLPLIFRTYIAGLSIDELTNLLNKKYKKYLKYPNLKIEIIRYRPVNIFIDGEVSEPGPYTLSGSNAPSITNKSNTSNNSPNQQIINPETNLTNVTNNLGSNSGGFISFPTVYTAIKSAKGVTLDADLSKIRITRLNPISKNGGRKETTINLLDYILEGDVSQNIRLRDGDTIFVRKGKELTTEQISRAIKLNLNPKFINVYVSGRINNPGLKKINKGSSLNDLLRIYGVLKTIRGPIIYISYKSDGTIVNRKINYDKNAKRRSEKNPILSNGDLVLVEKSTLSKTNEVLDEVTSPFVSILSGISIYKLLSN